MTIFTRRRLAFVATIALAATIGGATSFAATAVFNDVPAEHPFAAEISALAEAGITTGGADGNFYPGVDVKRQAMAAFLGRGLGRVDQVSDAFTIVAGFSPGNPVSITSGAAGDGGGYVALFGSFTAFTDDLEHCPCQVRGFLFDENDQQYGHEVIVDIASEGTETGYADANGSLMAVAPIPADTTKEFRLAISIHDADVSDVYVGRDLVAMYVPFDGDPLTPPLDD